MKLTQYLIFILCEFSHLNMFLFCYWKVPKASYVLFGLFDFIVGFGLFFFSRNNLLYRLVPKCLGPLQSVSLFFTSVCLSLKALVKSQILYSALKENKFQKTCIIKLELFLPILSPFPIYPVVLGSWAVAPIRERVRLLQAEECM